MRKQAFCLCENKGADQLRSNCEADQRLCFRYSDSTMSLLLKSEISSFKPSSVLVQLGLGLKQVGQIYEPIVGVIIYFLNKNTLRTWALESKNVTIRHHTSINT